MTAIKCVIWDLDGTVWPDIAIEGNEASLPTPSADVLATMDVLESRGLVNCVASRTDPSLLEPLQQQSPLASRIVAWRVGWAAKSISVRSIADELGIGLDAVTFVDDSGFERAEVSNSLPDVVVASPEELRRMLDTAMFTPTTITDDARLRPQRYREHVSRSRDEARSLADRDDFMHACDIRLDITVAGPDSIDRMSELISRSHRLNSTGELWPPQRLSAVVDDPAWIAATGSLTDRYGDYGLIACLLIERDEDAGSTGWRIRTLATSCRAAGRSVPTAMIAWAVAAAQAASADHLLVDVVPRPENVELRVLLRSAGFLAAAPNAGGEATPTIVLERSTAPPVDVPDWLTVRTPNRAHT